MQDTYQIFWMLILLYLIVVPVLLIALTKCMKSIFHLSTSPALAISATVSGVFLFFTTLPLISNSSDRGMGNLILLLFPAIDALLVGGGVVIGLIALVLFAAKEKAPPPVA